MHRGHIPERTCRGCGRKGPQKTMIRFVVAHGQLIEDSSRCLPGRGFYCCDEDGCRARMAKKVMKARKNGSGRRVVGYQKKGAFDE